MSDTEYFKKPLPAGWRILTPEMEVAGVKHHLDDVLSFMKSKQIEFDFEAEPGNEYDANAIKIIGIKHGLFRKKQFHLGYVPKEVAAEIAGKVSTADAVEFIAPRLTKIWFGDRGGLKIFIDIAVREDKFNIFSGKSKKKSKAKKEQDLDPSITVPEDEVGRNLLGEELEKKNLVENAIRCYQANVDDNSEGLLPYNRLAIIYRKRKQYEKEIEVLKKAIWVFEHNVNSKRLDIDQKLEKLRTRLAKAIELDLKNRIS